MGFAEKPKNIKEAMANSDKERLSAAGKKGAEKTNSLKKRKRERIEIHELQAALEVESRKLEDQSMREASNEHIITPDSEDLDYSKNT